MHGVDAACRCHSRPKVKSNRLENAIFSSLYVWARRLANTAPLPCALLPLVAVKHGSHPYLSLASQHLWLPAGLSVRSSSTTHNRETRATSFSSSSRSLTIPANVAPISPGSTTRSHGTWVTSLSSLRRNIPGFLLAPYWLSPVLPLVAVEHESCPSFSLHASSTWRGFLPMPLCDP
jgi:hypothetical protein